MLRGHAKHASPGGEAWHPRTSILVACLLALVGCAAAAQPPMNDRPFVIVLGITQDGGAPHAGCSRPCCEPRWEDPAKRLHVACLGIVDPGAGRWLIDATPDLPAQLRMLEAASPTAPGPGGILLTHAHIGHYAGLVHLGREVMGARDVPVYAMPRMRAFLETNGPWQQLVTLGNVKIETLTAGTELALSDRVTVTPIVVPHRDEYSETVGYRIRGPRASVLYIPDIDKWERWERSIEDEVAAVDVAFLDGTFYGPGELPGRDMSLIPHPMVVETVERLRELPAPVRSRVRFIHLNHTNPLLDEDGPQREAVERAGLGVAGEGERVEL
jgi:pyrroloquinoline quinone biosynthesis protein B